MQARSTLLCLLIASTATTLLAAVSELQSPGYNYLPPNEESATDEAVTTVAPVITTTENTAEATNPPASVDGPNGYEYRVVRRLKYRYRTQRDVSHLFRAEPHQRYLPPQTAEDDKISNEYLPPVDNDLLNTEATTTTTEGNETSAEPSTEAPQDTGVLAADGYHYRQPQVPVDLAPEIPVTVTEYLPPLEEDVVEAEGPGDESSVLSDDGYHYRVIRRFKF